MEEVSLYGAGGKPDWFMKLNPKGEVPVLVGFGGKCCAFLGVDILDTSGAYSTRFTLIF